MITVEIKSKQEKNEEGAITDSEFLVINGIPDEESYFGKGKVKYACFSNDEVITILQDNTFNEVGKNFTMISYATELEYWKDYVEIDIICSEYFDVKIPCIKIRLQFDNWEQWTKPWSMSSVAKQFEINIEELSKGKIKYWQDDDDSILNGFGFEYFPSNDLLNIGTEVSYLLHVLKSVVNATNKNLLTSLESESVLTYFQFPEEIKTACKQYLIYFTQFIADMGILVDTELKEELNHTLFKIIPKDKDESLDRIREVLNIYLNAPNERNFQIEISNQTDIAVKQWEANFYHLKSQLSLATSIIQAKDTTIEMLQLSNYQYRQLLESHNTKKGNEKEDIIKGIVEVKKYEGKVFNINFAEIFRRLKRSIK